MKDKKQNYLASAEMDEESNYNMIDGIINNTPKPSLLERMKEYEQRVAENAKKDDSTAVKKVTEHLDKEDL